jgi:hypothetical protein
VSRLAQRSLAQALAIQPASALTKMTGAFQGPQWPTPTYRLAEEPYRQMLWKQPSLGVLQMHEDPVERFK